MVYQNFDTFVKTIIVMKDYYIRFVYDRRKEASHKKDGLLQIEVRKENTDRRAYVTTGIRITPEQFDAKNGFTCRSHPQAKRITGRAHDRFKRVESFVSSDRCRSIKDVKNWNKDVSSESTIVDFIKSELRRRNPSLSVVRYNNSFIRRLEEYGKIRTFEDLTYDNIVGLDAKLRETIESDPTLYKRHTLFKGYIQEAINRGIYTGLNPYAFFKLKKGKSETPVFLVESEIERIKRYDPYFDYLKRTKDLFLFQCFTGMAYIDLMNFTHESVSELEGYKIIRSSRHKTDESYITLLLPEAQEIAERYEYDLPKLTNQKYNSYLKQVAKETEINKNLTSHVARHTFATYLLNKNIPIETVSKAMGHSNIKMTQHYARLLGKKVVSDMSVLLKK